jgi:outer membrane protein assembly factor BamB
MFTVPRRHVLRSVGSLSLATGLAGCGTSGTADQCGDEPRNESRNVETEPGGETPPLPDAGWPQPAYDGTNARYSSGASGVQAPARLVWSQSFGFESTIVPVVEDGVVYVSDDADRLTAVDAQTGSIAWGSSEVSVTGPVAAGDGVVFVADGDGLHAVDTASREVRWTFAASDGGGAMATDSATGHAIAPTVTETTVYVASASRRVHAVDRETGTERWQADGERVAAASGEAVFVYDSGNVMAVEADDGTARWTDPIDAGRTVAVADGGVYGTVDAATVAAFDVESGEKRWEFERTHQLLEPPAVSPNGVFVGTESTEMGDGGNLYVLDPDSGERRWCAHLGFERVRSPSVTDDTVFVPRSNGLLQARATDDGTLRWQFHGDHADFGSVAVVGSLAFAGTRNGKLFAFAPA